MKRIICIIVLVLFPILMLCACEKRTISEDKNKTESGIYPYEGLKYVVLEDGTAEITGYSADETVSSLIIPDYIAEGVKISSIADDAFAGNDKLDYVEFPKYITKIGKNSFKDSSVRNIIMVSSRSLVEIGDGAFENCKRLVQADLPDSLKTIGKDAFVNCSSLVVVTFRGDMKNLNGEIFKGTGEFKICTYSDNDSVLAFADKYGYDVQILPRN